MSIVRHRIKSNLYRDSAALMRLASALLAQPGVTQAAAMMATPGNRAALADSGLPLPPDLDLRADDLLLAVEGDGETEVEAALDWAEAELQRPTGMGWNETETALPPRTLEDGVWVMPEAELALISVPGEHAYAEALKALKAGLHAFLFSSRVALEDEARLKRMAARRGLLMMGAECGTAILNGVPLGFANVVRRGKIGLVAASGSGLQEVCCLIHRWGGGISHAIGAGGRDLSEAVGGITTLAGLRLLLDEPGTDAVVLISKPPAASVAERILKVAARTDKPIVVTFLGTDPAPIRAAGLTPAATLEETARLALAAVGITPPEEAPIVLPPVELPRRFVRGLFAGGTLCAEAMLVMQALGVPVIQPEAADPLPPAHTCLDLGAEEFTCGRPHPMIDARLRAELLRRAVCDPQTAVVIFDVILGHGASPDPCGPLLEAMAGAGNDRPAFVAHVCGTEADPQGMEAQIARLRTAGAILAPSNAAAARVAAECIRRGR